MNTIDLEMIDTLERWDFIKDQNEMVDLQFWPTKTMQLIKYVLKFIFLIDIYEKYYR